MKQAIETITSIFVKWFIAATIDGFSIRAEPVGLVLLIEKNGTMVSQAVTPWTIDMMRDSPEYFEQLLEGMRRKLTKSP